MKRITFITLSIIFFSLITQAQTFEEFYENDKSGLKNGETGEVILPAKYDWVFFNDKYASVHLKHKVMLIDGEGKEIFPLEYDDINTCDMFPDLCILRIKDKYTIHNLKTKKDILKDFKLDDGGACFNFDGPSYITEEGRIPAIVKGKAGLIDIMGKEYLPFEYDKIISEYYTGGNMYLLKKGKKNYILLNEKKIKIGGKDVYGFFDDNAVVQSSGKKIEFYNLEGDKVDINPKQLENGQHLFRLDHKGKDAIFSATKKQRLTDFKYDYLNIYDQKMNDGSTAEYIFTYIGDKTGIMDNNAKEITKVEYDDISKTYDKNQLTFVVEKNKKKGLMNIEGKLLTEIKYDEIGLQEDLKFVKYNDKFGYIDNQGKLVIPIKYTKANQFNSGFAAVENNGKWGYINPAGIMIIPAIYDNAYYFNKAVNLACVKKDGKFGFIDTKGKVIIPIKYDKLGYFWNGKVKLYLDGKQIMLDAEGNKI